MKIATTNPNATDIILALGQGSRLVAISQECRDDALLERCPRIVWLADVGLNPRPAPEFVDTLSSLSPELVLTVTTGSGPIAEALVAEESAKVGGPQPVQLVLKVETLDELWQALETTGEMLGLGMLATAIACGIRARLVDVARPLMHQGVGRKNIVLEGRHLLEEPEFARLQMLGAYAHCELLSSDDSRVATDGAGALRLVVLAASGAASVATSDGSRLTLRIGAAHRGIGPRSVELVELIAAAVWGDALPSLTHRHRERLRV